MPLSNVPEQKDSKEKVTVIEVEYFFPFLLTSLPDLSDF